MKNHSYNICSGLESMNPDGLLYGRPLLCKAEHNIEPDSTTEL